MRTRNQIVKQGTNLNQMARSLNSGGTIPESLDRVIELNHQVLQQVEAAAEYAHKQLVQAR
jgi:hypothetical protein